MDPASNARLAAFKKLQQEYATSISSKMAEVKTLRDAIEPEQPKDTIAALKMCIHKLAGNSSAFGFVKAGDVAAAFEVFLSETPSHLNSAWFSLCDRYIQQLEEAFHAHNGQ